MKRRTVRPAVSIPSALAPRIVAPVLAPQIVQPIPVYESPGVAAAAAAAQKVTGTLTDALETRTVRTDIEAGTRFRVQLDRPWSACDVFLSIDAPFPVTASAAWIQARIFANAAQSGPVLVGSGLMRGYNRDTGSAVPSPRWTAGARAASGEFFDIEILIVSPQPLSVTLTTTVVGRNDVTPVPDWVGVSQAQYSGVATDALTNLASISSGQFVERPEVMQIDAVTTAAAPRFLQLFDRLASAAPAPGSVPDFVWSVPASGLIVKPRYRCRRGMYLVTSSAPGTLVAAGAADTFIQAMVR